MIPGGHGSLWGYYLTDYRFRYGVLTTAYDIPLRSKLLMLTDRVIAMCVGFVGVALVQAQREIRCRDEKKRRFFEALFNSWSRTFMLQANMAIALGSVGLLKRWAFKAPPPVSADGPDPWAGKATPYIIEKFDIFNPEDVSPAFEDDGRLYAGIDTPAGRIDPHFTLWLTIGKHRAFGSYYGYGRLQNCYRDWWLSQFGGDQYTVSLQRMADQVVMVTYPPGVDPRTNTQHSDIALSIGDSVRNGATVALPSTVYTTMGATGEDKATGVPEWGLQFLQGTAGLGQFHEIDSYHGQQMAMGYLVPPQAFMNVKQSALGGPTTADVLADVAEEMIVLDAQEIDDQINAYVFPPIEAANFPSDSPPVTVHTTGLASDNRAQLMEVVKVLMGQHPDSAYFDFREAMARLEFPLRPEAEVEKERKEQEAEQEKLAKAEAEAAAKQQADGAKEEADGAREEAGPAEAKEPAKEEAVEKPAPKAAEGMGLEAGGLSEADRALLLKRATARLPELTPLVLRAGDVQAALAQLAEDFPNLAEALGPVMAEFGRDPQRPVSEGKDGVA